MLQFDKGLVNSVKVEYSARGVRLFEEHRMRRQHAEFDRRPFLIDARGALAAMDNLPGREANRVEILGATELAGKDS